MEKEILLKEKMLKFIIPFLIISNIITIFNIYLSAKQNPENLEDFNVVLIIFIFISIIVSLVVILFFKKFRKIYIFEKKIIFYYDLFDSKNVKRVDLDFENILKIDENIEKEEFTIFFEYKKIKNLSILKNFSQDEKIFSKKDFQNENDYYEFLEILKQKSGK